MLVVSTEAGSTGVETGGNILHLVVGMPAIAENAAVGQAVAPPSDLIAGVALNGEYLLGSNLFHDAGVCAVIERGAEKDLVSRLQGLGVELALDFAVAQRVGATGTGGSLRLTEQAHSHTRRPSRNTSPRTCHTKHSRSFFRYTSEDISGRSLWHT